MPVLKETSTSRILASNEIVKRKYHATFWRKGDLRDLDDPEKILEKHWSKEVNCGACASFEVDIIFNGEFGVALGEDIHVIEVKCKKCGSFSLWEEYKSSS